jgi:hypothetical protein
LLPVGSRCTDEPVAEIVPNTQPLPRARSKSVDHSELPVLLSMSPLSLDVMEP